MMFFNTFTATKEALRNAVFIACAAVVGLTLTSCDSSPNELGNADVSASSEAPIVEYTLMPDGDQLLPPGATAFDTERKDSKNGEDIEGQSSAYGCYLATRPYSEDVRFHSVYLHFPDDVVRRAGNQTQQVRFDLKASQTGRPDTTTVRYANCVIPKTDVAKEIAIEQILRNGETNAVQNSVNASEGGADSKSCTIRVTAVTCAGIGSNEVCGPDGYAITCGYGGGGGGSLSGWFQGGSDPWGDPSGGGSGPGDRDGGGSGGETCRTFDPQPGSNCAPAHPASDEPVSKDVVMDLFQEVCGFPDSERDTEKTSDIFEHSVVASFNSALPSSHHYKLGDHPELSEEPDGYAKSSINVENGIMMDIITSIIESKFSEKFTGNMSSSQSKRQINDLARSYSQFTEGKPVTGAPLYVLVTNSQRPLEQIGRYSFGAPSDLPSYANSKDVNFMHYHIVTGPSGGLRLKGKILGEPQTTRSTIQDLTHYFETDFIVKCIN